MRGEKEIKAGTTAALMEEVQAEKTGRSAGLPAAEVAKGEDFWLEEFTCPAVCCGLYVESPEQLPSRRVRQTPDKRFDSL